ncbi:MAG TPA: hypothetical protein VET24_01195, partial [Actinomycetota bacterium]|nr:hypothetical protein [Actinomycetota bacterium]
MSNVDGEVAAALAPAIGQPAARREMRTLRWRRGLTPVALVALAASAVLAVDPSGVRERVFGSVAPPRPAAVSRIAGEWSTT